MIKINTKKYIQFMVLGAMISMHSIASAENISSSKQVVEFFASNNSQVIDVKNAYERLTHQAQHDLKKDAITVLQKEHVEQGSFESILGLYQMANDKRVTGDNTTQFHTSPYQYFSTARTFALAVKLAKALNQESIAVFIPSAHAGNADTIVTLSSNNVSIDDAIRIINEKLPAYSTAFSLHLMNKPEQFDQAKVKEIEWLGSKIDINLIKKAFPDAHISSKQGQAYLVYKTGQVDTL